VLPIFGKPRLSSFQRFLRITIPVILEEVMAVFVTVRDAEKLKTEEKAHAPDDQRPHQRQDQRFWSRSVPLVVRLTTSAIPAHRAPVVHFLAEFEGQSCPFTSQFVP